MKKLKFNEYDRHHVKSEIEIQLNTKLNTVGTYRKYFMDYNGSAYLIFGGIENWHGIQSKAAHCEVSSLFHSRHHLRNFQTAALDYACGVSLTYHPESVPLLV